MYYFSSQRTGWEPALSLPDNSDVALFKAVFSSLGVFFVHSWDFCDNILGFFCPQEVMLARVLTGIVSHADIVFKRLNGSGWEFLHTGFPQLMLHLVQRM